MVNELALENSAEKAESSKVESALPKRRKRAPVTGEQRLKLSAPTRPGYVRRFVNDSGNRIRDLYDRDYEYVEDKSISTDGEGTRVCRRVGVKKDGSPLYAYLMEVPEKYYQEDQREKQRPLDEFDEAILRGEVNRKPGDGLHVERVKISTQT